ncbi:hypothetical protein BDQ12DRAFT_2176 [Crucibulum laeve]|uniref:Transmembrane protein n=1 Tax=Crucibulum laeve TaxID=68775 RepID=A0A5C3MFR0_9AGAR|nr:hypothetical protein BDQ12DRAFT_2176 [Crucibulum laeve]
MVKIWTTWPTVVSLLTVEVILILRVLALYSNNKKIAYFLFTLITVEMIAFSGIVLMAVLHTRGFSGENVFSGCLFILPGYFYTGWIPGIIFESILIILTIYKSLKFANTCPTVKVLTRDSVVYFFSMFSILVFNLVYSIYGNKLIAPLIIHPSSVLSCIAAARLTMNIRKFTMRSFGDDSTTACPNDNPPIPGLSLDLDELLRNNVNVNSSSPLEESEYELLQRRATA